MTWTIDDIPREARDAVDHMVNSLVDEETCLLAVTGSLANLTWRPGWSDIDLLLVRRSLPSEWVQGRTGAMAHTAQVSMFSQAEAEDGAVPPRVLNALRGVAADGRGILTRDPSWAVPDFGLAAGAAASLRDLPQALLLLRRHLASDRIDIRAVYKLCILIARIELRAIALEPDVSDDVVAEANARFEGLGPRWLPRLAEVSPPIGEGSEDRLSDDVKRGAGLLLAAQAEVQSRRSERRR